MVNVARTSQVSQRVRTFRTPVWPLEDVSLMDMRVSANEGQNIILVKGCWEDEEELLDHLRRRTNSKRVVS